MDLLKEALHELAEPTLDRLAERGAVTRRVTHQLTTDEKGKQHTNILDFPHRDGHGV